jgi:hypothetical protein
MRSRHASYVSQPDEGVLFPPELILLCTFHLGIPPIASRRVRPITKRTPKVDGDRQP